MESGWEGESEKTVLGVLSDFLDYNRVFALYNPHAFIITFYKMKIQNAKRSMRRNGDPI